jgi:hypothetical protein
MTLIKPNHTPERLEEAILAELIERIEEGEKVLPKGADEPVVVSAPASTITAAVAFLKFLREKNGEPPAAAGEMSDTLRGYANKMPFARKA